MKSKLLSIFLTLSMIVTLLPAAAIDVLADDAVAQIVDGASYSDLQDAVNNAQDGDTVKLLRDAVLNKDGPGDNANTILIENKRITLDLNDHGVIVKYNRSGFHVIRLVGTANLTLTDSTAEADKTTRYIELINNGTDNVGRGKEGQTAQPDGAEGTNYITVKGGYITGGYGSG